MSRQLVRAIMVQHASTAPSSRAAFNCSLTNRAPFGDRDDRSRGYSHNNQIGVANSDLATISHVSVKLGARLNFQRKPRPIGSRLGCCLRKRPQPSKIVS